MSRLTTTVALAVLAVGGAFLANSLSSPGLSTSELPAPSPSLSVVPHILDDGGVGDSESPSPVPNPTGSTPTAVHLPTSSATIRPVGINPDGSMEIPDDPREVGWYTLTDVRPGDAGTAVIAGHVDSRTQGKGAFFELANLRVGDEIVLETEHGIQYWTVTKMQAYKKAELPIVDVFSLTGTPRLALVTCGGEFDRVTRSYTENVVVYAHQKLSTIPGTT